MMNMRPFRYILLVVLLLGTAWRTLAQVDEGGVRQVDIERVEVRGTRLLKETGIQCTRLDSVALHDNISLSMGDVLLQNTNTFIKSYGRGTVATVSVRGTAPSHTQVVWNGMSLNSPMLGMVDFSLIPAYFVDDAALYAGASSVGVVSGGLGGALTLDNCAPTKRGFGLRYVQGVASFCTFDEFLQLTYGGERWSSSTRLLYSSSRNNFKYVNYNRMPELVTDESGDVVGRKYPTERNRNGDYGDFHLLQEAYCNTPSGNRFGVAVWFTLSERGVPKLSTDYREQSFTRAAQDEKTLRAVLSWNRIISDVRVAAKAGYTYTDMLYRYLFDITGVGEEMIEGIHSQSTLHTAFGRVEAEYSLRDKFMVAANITANQHFVESLDEAVYNNIGEERVIGYRQARFELSASATVRYRPVERFSVATSARWDLYGRRSTPLVPALFVEGTLSRRGNLLLKASITRNYRYPTLNDLYFQPGGNPDLKPEHGFTYDGGLSFDTAAGGRVHLSGEVTAFDSYIDDWILWRPTFKGFWTPLNIRRVHSYGFEVKANLAAELGRGWRLEANGLFSMTRSLNMGDKVSENDASYGRQLPYIPLYTSSATLRLGWRGWSLAYKWRYYSERYTTSSNDLSPSGVVAPYFMNDISLEKRFAWRWGELSVRVDVNNLLGEEYETVLAHPMPRRNFGLYIGISPDFGCKSKRRVN